MLRRLFEKKRSAGTSGVALGREFSVGDVLEQRYEIEQVRRGYMGIVYVAYDRQRRGRVAIKTFQNKFLWDEAAIGRFNAEAELWMRLGAHPNIVRAFDLRQFLGKPHVVAEYVHGGPLRTLVNHLDFAEALDYAIQVCRGMSYAVEQVGIIHCDLKPDNVMVTLDGQAKITDFGLARVLPNTPLALDTRQRGPRIRSHLTDSLGGTLPYMAPELFDQPAYPGTWSDIYALGVMLFELFAGRLPFDSMRDESLIRMHRKQAPLDPRELRPNLPPGATEVVLRCLDKQPSRRYQSFGEVERDLQALRASAVGEQYKAVTPGASGETWAERGMMHMELGEWSEALSCFRQAAEQDQTLASNWLNLARARLRLWQYNEALGATDNGLQHASSRNEFGQLYQVRGETFAAMLRPADALAAFDKGLSYTPNAPALWRERGALFLKMDRAREAAECIQKALKFDKLDSQAWRLMGEVQVARGQFKQAHKTLGESLKLDPRSALGWARYGHVQLKLDRAQEALRSFEAALKLDPDLAEASDGIRMARERQKSK